MGWFAGQLLWYLLGAFLLGLLAGYLWWVWGWKKYRDEQVTRDVDRRTQRSGAASAATTLSAGAAAGAAGAGSAGTKAGAEADRGRVGAGMNTLVGSTGAAATAGAAATDATDATDAPASAIAELRRKLADTEEELRLERQRSAELHAETETLKARMDTQAEELRTVSEALDTAREQAKAAEVDREQIIDLRDEAETLRERVRTLEATSATAVGTGSTGGNAGAGASSSNRSRAAGVQGLVGATDGAARSGDDHQPEPDDELERIEGIGPKIGDALRAAGIRTFARLASSDEPALRTAIETAGLRFAPSLPTWAAQAAYLVSGDEEGFLAYTTRLVAGRDPGAAKGDR